MKTSAEFREGGRSRLVTVTVEPEGILLDGRRFYSPRLFGEFLAAGGTLKVAAVVDPLDAAMAIAIVPEFFVLLRLDEVVDLERPRDLATSRSRFVISSGGRVAFETIREGDKPDERRSGRKTR